MTSWYIEGFKSDRQSIARTNITHFPFQIGRKDGIELTIPSNSVSRIHAIILFKQGRLFIQDVGSTNGTQLNNIPLTKESAIYSGDIIQLGDCELRIIKEDSDEAFQQTTMIVPGFTQQINILSGAKSLEALIANENVHAMFQPIVGRDAKSLIGYEILGRGNHPELSPSPLELFDLAECFGLTTSLSELFRNIGIKHASTLAPHRYFLNIHPDELNNVNRLIKSLEHLRTNYQDLRLVLEVHEEAVTNPKLMKQFNHELNQLNIELAYDDFGAGQGRLLEFVEVPPKIIKFDKCMIENIDKATPNHLKLIKSLVDIAKDMGTLTLAECVETAEEVEVCKHIGMDLYQGYFIDRPLPSPSRH